MTAVDTRPAVPPARTRVPSRPRAAPCGRGATRPRARQAVLAVGTAIAAIAVALAVVVQLDVASDTAATLATVARTRAEVAAARERALAIDAEVLDARSARTTVRASLDRQVAELRWAAGRVAATRAERDGVVADLQARSGELGTTTVFLAAAEEERTATAGQVTDLQACLTGVDRALTLTAFADHGAALRALAVVRPRCDAAGVAP